MYPEFLETATKEGNTDAARIFRLAMKAEEVHASNYQDVLANLQDTDYLNEKYSEVFRCVTCGEVVTERPDRCPICGAQSNTFVSYTANKSILSNTTVIALIVVILIIAVVAVALLVKRRIK
jgi:rubrerythrin